MNTKKLIAATLAVTVLPLSISTLGAQKVDAFIGMPLVLKQKVTEKVTVDLTSYEEAYQKAEKLLTNRSGYTAASLDRIETELQLRDVVLKETSQEKVDEATKALDVARTGAVRLYYANSYSDKYNAAFADENGEWVNLLSKDKISLPNEVYDGHQYGEGEWSRILEANAKLGKLLELSTTVAYDPTQKEVDAVANEMRNAAEPWMFDFEWCPAGVTDFWDFIYG